ncbi:zinc-ribbon domain-containing protein [uncultured Megasphaera sp.]|uniref:zinc-ribbon domain-containing protein n=1 Tax=uncultured Megasphaera sp. TaxID=165188 RepID=UPI0025D1A0DA|nr:zinc-ribbon domain-containing protein [uncultured Megasphaera sp.]
MMFCTQCGKKIQDDAKFCPYCGATVRSAEDSKEPVEPAEPEDPVEPTEEPRQQVHNLTSRVRNLWPKDRKQRVRMWNRFVVAVLVCMMGAFLYSVHDDGSDVSKEEQALSDPTKQEEKQAPVKEQKPVKLPAPASITSFEVDENVIGEPVAYIQIKNDSDKTIDGFKVRLSARDNFGQEVTEFGYGDPFTVLMSQRTIEPRGLSSDSYHWTLHGLENGRKFHVELAEIHYTNGTSWNSSWSDPVTADTKQTGVQV